MRQQNRPEAYREYWCHPGGWDVERFGGAMGAAFAERVTRRSEVIRRRIGGPPALVGVREDNEEPGLQLPASYAVEPR